MDFLKKHYEKVILGVVLIGPGRGSGLPAIQDFQRQGNLGGTERADCIHPQRQALTNLDLTIAENASNALRPPALINFGEPNKLFNPMPWQKSRRRAPDPGRPGWGPTAAVVTNITPLYLRLTLDSVTVSRDRRHGT